jgi:hypothetical protein
MICYLINKLDINQDKLSEQKNLTASLRLGPVTIAALAIFICLMPFLYDLRLKRKV